MPSRSAVVEFSLATASAEERGRWEILRDSVGLATSIAVIPMFLEHAGFAFVAAGAGTDIIESQTTVDLEDARIDSMRFVGYGSSNGAGDSVRLMDGTTAITGVTASLANGAAARFVGAWVLPSQFNSLGGDRSLKVQVVGNGARVQTIYRIDLQVRTVRIVRR